MDVAVVSGHYVRPAIVELAAPCEVSERETFAPILYVLRYEALDDAEWEDGEILALGTSPRVGIAQVFLGTRGSKIMRVSPVPVLVLPG